VNNLSGQTLGQYELKALIGRGGMASVYRALQPSINREVAIKVIHSDLLHQSPDFLARFKREAQLLANLSHPHILKVFDYGHQDDTVYIVMELLHGGTLNDWLRKGHVSPPHALRMLAQIGAALDYAHARNIVHRDLKPQNVLLDEAENAYLTDFGIAKLLHNPSLTATGQTVGTPSYMAPEQWDPTKEVDARADIYSLGVIAYEMLSGRVPFGSQTSVHLMYEHLTKIPPSPREFNDKIPQYAESLLLRALAKDPAVRFNAAGEFTEALKASYNYDTATMDAFPHPRRSVPGWILAAGLVSAALIVLVAFAALRGTPATNPTATRAATSAVVQVTITPLPVTAAASNATPMPAAGATRTDALGIAQVWLPPACFQMGSNPALRREADPNETPQHKVCLSRGFWIDQYEVSNAQYQAFIDAGGYDNARYWSLEGWAWLQAEGVGAPQPFSGFDAPNQPRVGVSWYEAEAYARWRGGRLLTEAEWEYAATGGTTRRYPWGDDYKAGSANLNDSAMNGNPLFKTAPVGTYLTDRAPNVIFDLAGNVREWVADWYDPQVYQNRNEISDPLGVMNGEARVLRGASWSDGPNQGRTAHRSSGKPGVRSIDVGFRIALPN